MTFNPSERAWPGGPIMTWNPSLQAWPGGPHPAQIAAMQQAQAAAAHLAMVQHLLLLRR